MDLNLSKNFLCFESLLRIALVFLELQNSFKYNLTGKINTFAKGGNAFSIIDS